MRHKPVLTQTFGVPATTMRGMKEPQMKQIAKWINNVADNINDKKKLSQIKTEIKKPLSKIPSAWNLTKSIRFYTLVMSIITVFIHWKC